MADKITLGSVGNIDNSLLTTINNNNALITTAFDNTLSRDGTTPNQMFATLDMNSFQVLNLPSPATVNSPARLVDVVTNPTITVPAVGTSGAVVGLLNTNNTESGNNTYSGTNSFTGPSNTFTNTVTMNGTVNFASLPTFTMAGRSVLGNNSSVSGPSSALTIPALLGLQLVPTAATNAIALQTTSTGAGTANQGTGLQQYYNLLNITGDNVNCGNNNTTSFSLGLLINQAFGGTNCFGGRIGLSSELTMTSPTAATNGVRFYAAVLGQGQANTSDGAAGGRMYGGNFLGVLTSGATSNFSQCSALYDQIFIQSGASVTTKTIHTLAYGASDAIQGFTTDAAILISAETGAAAGGKNAILISNVLGAQPLATSATVLNIQGSPTITNGIDLSNATISGSAFKSPGFSVGGGGNVLSASNAQIANGTAIPAGGTAAVGYLFSSTTNFGIFFGSGAPTLSAAQGSIYLRSDGAINARMYINTNGTTGWTAFNTIT